VRGTLAASLAVPEHELVPKTYETKEPWKKKQRKEASQQNKKQRKEAAAKKQREKKPTTPTTTSSRAPRRWDSFKKKDPEQVKREEQHQAAFKATMEASRELHEKGKVAEDAVVAELLMESTSWMVQRLTTMKRTSDARRLLLPWRSFLSNTRRESTKTLKCARRSVGTR
jgi:hypothetical protein